MFRFKRLKFTTTQIIADGFLAAILIGALLLMLPISSSSGEWTDPLDALFTATTSICVTGLVTLNTAAHWSLFGKTVITILIQFGGLGVITFTTVVFLLLRKRITLKERMLIQEAYNLDTLRGLVKLTIKILKATLLTEGFGAALLCLKFIPEMNFLEGIGNAVFLSVSAFCNAGMDTLGTASLEPYKGSILVNFVIMFLILMGGIGFPVWWDIIRIWRIRQKEKEKVTLGDTLRKLELHTKIVLTVTLIMIFSGALLIFILEWDNPDTIGKLPWWQKGLASLFQSVTLRTAGFQTIPQENFENATSMLFLIFMFIGGSPSGTAGGIKTTTVGMLFFAVVGVVKGNEDTEAFNRKIPSWYIKKGLAVVLVSFTALTTSVMLLSIVQQNADFLDVIFECTSAIGTVGLTRGFTGQLNPIGQLIIICTMYIGRVGPITLALFFNSKKRKNIRKLPKERIIVG